MKRRSQFLSFGNKFVALAVILYSWTFPRVGPFRISEPLLLLYFPSALKSRHVLNKIFYCYGFFFIITVFSYFKGFFIIGTGDNTISSEKVFYSTPELVLVISILRIIIYLMSITSLTHFFLYASTVTLRRTLFLCYIVTLLPGCIQLFRIYSGFYFDLPFERLGVGPFSGVFNAGYLRLMGFEFEPMAYASSLVVVCCLRFYSGGRLPLLGILVLAYTYSFGAIVAFILAILLGWSHKYRRMLIPFYLLFYLLSVSWIYANLDELLSYFSFVRSVAERINATGASINMFFDHLLGVGLGLYGYYFNLYDKTGLVADRLDYYPNNDPIMFLAYGGVLYLLAYIWVFHYAIVSTSSRWIRIALFAILIQSASAYIFFNPVTAVVISLALSGRILIQSKSTKSKRYIGFFKKRRISNIAMELSVNK